MSLQVNRRQILKSVAAGALGAWAAPRLFSQSLAQQSGVQRLADKLAVMNAGGSNVVAFSDADGIVLVDSGAAGSGDQLTAALKSFAPNAKVTTLLNTHYHLDQTANNEMFAAAGAKIVAQVRTKDYMANKLWVPADRHYLQPRPKGAWPTETFVEKGSMKAGEEQINYGYLLMAHTSGDAYYHFKNANVLVVGDVASPERDPSFDWYTGGWVGGRADAMNFLLTLMNDQTKIVPAYGPVMTKAQFAEEYDMMDEVRQRIFDHVRAGEGPQDMLENGTLDGLARKWKDPYTFLYAAAKGAWGHHDKLGANVV